MKKIILTAFVAAAAILAVSCQPQIIKGGTPSAPVTEDVLAAAIVLAIMLLPYLISVIMTYISREIPSLISYEVFLSYMGLGLGATYASLGRSISQYTSFMTGYPHLFWIPVIVLAIISISLYVVGQRLADATDPRTHR